MLYPYHWGGAFSIFNPDMVDSVKLSDGVISARYGQILSGLLEVNSIAPDQDQAHWNLGMSTIGTDVFLQTPLTKDAALLLGGKLTDLSDVLNAVGAGGVFSHAPYIKEGFGKLTWNPSPSLRTFLNAYWGADGVGIANDSTDKSIVTNQKFDYTNTELLLSSGVKILLDDHNLLDFLVSFNSWDFNVAGRTVTNGTKTFDQDFINEFNPGSSSFTLNNLTNSFSQDKTEYLLQAKADWDWEAAPGQVFSFGQESLLQYWTSDLNLNSYQIFNTQGSFQYLPIVLDTQTTGQKTVTEGLFALYNFTVVPGTLVGEAGLRIDDSVVFNDQMTLQTQPAVNPRVLLTYTPVKDWNWVRSLSLLGGAGLFSQFPADNQYIDKKYGLTDFSLGPERAWFNELGTEVLTQDDWKIDLTGYWKSYFDRYYSTFISPSQYTLRTDGTGYAYGFDVFFQKRTRAWDVSLAYSLIISRLYDPGTGNPSEVNTNGDPLGTWFYPSYQRFHNVSFVGTVNPSDGFSITTEAQIASGTPLAKVGPATSFAATTKDGTVVEMFSRTSAYDDNLRIGWSYPVSVKFSWHDFFTGVEGPVGILPGRPGYFCHALHQRAARKSPRRSVVRKRPFGDVGRELQLRHSDSFRRPQHGILGRDHEVIHPADDHRKSWSFGRLLVLSGARRLGNRGSSTGVPPGNRRRNQWAGPGPNSDRFVSRRRPRGRGGTRTRRRLDRLSDNSQVVQHLAQRLDRRVVPSGRRCSIREKQRPLDRADRFAAVDRRGRQGFAPVLRHLFAGRQGAGAVFPTLGSSSGRGGISQLAVP